MLNSAEYSEKVRELADTNADLAKLKAKKSELEAWFAVIGNEALKPKSSPSSRPAILKSFSATCSLTL